MIALPTGTVAFVFTDVEGSTALWQQHLEVMVEVIAHHDALLKEIVTAHGGVVFRSDLTLVPSAIMAPLGLREEGGRGPKEIVRDFLAPKQLYGGHSRDISRSCRQPRP